MRITTTPTALALLLGLGLALAACAPQQETGEPAGGPLGTAQQPTASPSEVQEEQPQAQQPGGGPIQ